MQPPFEIRPFQRPVLRDLLDPAVDTVALSCPRGNGKSSLIAWLAARTLTPGDPLHEPEVENFLCAASLGQSRRTTFKLLRRMVEGTGNEDFRIAESSVACHVLHVPSRAKVTVLASNGKTAQGLIDCRWAICDEPGSWQTAGGAAMWDALRTAMGKPASRLKVVLIGTIAPASQGWWPELLKEGNTGTTRVHLFQASEDDLERWDNWHVIQRANPLMAKFAESRAKLLEERNAARKDSRKKAAFISYRLNVPTLDKSTVLLSVGEWKRLLRRPIAPREGRPVVGIDLGAGRGWSSAVGLWESGRTEAVAIAPGLPSVEDQERRDGVHPSTYQRLVDQGSLLVAEGLHVPPPGLLVDLVRDWKPRAIVCDRFRLGDLRDTNPPCPIIPRVSRWSESTHDIRALRRFALDGPLSVAVGSRALLQASLAVTRLKSDDAGNTRLTKSRNNRARDDVAAGWILACGARARIKPTQRPKFALVG